MMRRICLATMSKSQAVTCHLLMQYMIEIWKAAGMDMTRVQFLNASEEINKSPNEYWTLVMDIARQNTLARITKCCQIMGRSESDNLSASQIFYPCMQCADIFFLKVAVYPLLMVQCMRIIVVQLACILPACRHQYSSNTAPELRHYGTCAVYILHCCVMQSLASVHPLSFSLLLGDRGGWGGSGGGYIGYTLRVEYMDMLLLKVTP